MIDQPGLRLRIEPAAGFSTEGHFVDRVSEFALRWTRFHRLAVPPSCRISVRSAPRQHVGLGVGTQLGMSVAAGLCCFAGYQMPSPDELAMSVGRGKRSAIGTYGFATGGLLAERGCLDREPIAPLDCQLDLPPSWQMVLTCPRGEGLSGAKENHAFEELPPVPRASTELLQRIMRERMFPAAARCDFKEFSKSVYDYGHQAGACFAASQGGPYNGPLLTRIVRAIRERGVEGVGQSSWGPTIFAIVESAENGETLAKELRRRFSFSKDEVWVSEINHGGANIQVFNQSPTAVH
jgi:beta-ribofuranosylaminobenzene 5'-phosphate synthase